MTNGLAAGEPGTCDFKDCTHRMPLSIALSYDGGTTWPYVRDLEYENHYPEQVRLQLSSRHSRPSLKSVSRSCRPARAAWRPGPRSYGVLVPHRAPGCGWAAAREPLVQPRHDQVSLLRPGDVVPAWQPVSVWECRSVIAACRKLSFRSERFVCSTGTRSCRRRGSGRAAPSACSRAMRCEMTEM